MNAKDFDSFGKWLESLRDHVAQPLIKIERELAPVRADLAASDVKLASLTAALSDAIVTGRARRKFLQDLHLGFLCNLALPFASFEIWLTGGEATLREQLLTTSSAKQQLLQTIRKKEAPLATLPSANSPICQAKPGTASFSNYAMTQWEDLQTIKEVREVKVTDGWLKITTAEIICHSYDDYDCAYNLGVLTIFLKPGQKVYVRRPAGTVKDPATGLLWHAPHFHDTGACYGKNESIYESYLERGMIFSLVDLLVKTLKGAGNDSWGGPIARLFPKVRLQSVTR